ncbi:hypothetical protein [Vogesella indigofera]|uniref:hypothetical protein n=1 Tax=Vogesella indigofera TaxID=45465 RepID=UPI00234D425A|nr:hypothetical protein [Vogesella indigofera]MDC7704041.1 hypothetical protein [Vogesella indigofera]
MTATANNPYFDHSTGDKRLIPGDTARAGDVNALLDAVSAGFTKAMTDISLRLPLPEGTQTSIPLTPAARAARALVFGADGNLETWPAIDAVTVSQLFAARDESVQQASAASSSANAAAAEASKAQDWAIKAGDPVLGGEYSAKHHAQQAAVSAQQVAAQLASIAAGPVYSVNGLTGPVTLTAEDVDAQPVMANATGAEMQAGTMTELRAMSPKNVADAIAALTPKSVGAGSASGSGSVVLTGASPALQAINTTAFGQSVTLPDARTLTAGVPVFGISNTGSFPLMVLDNGGALLGFVGPQSEVIASLSGKVTAAGVWQLLGATIAGVDAHACLQLPISDTTTGGRLQVVTIDNGRSLLLFGGASGLYAAIYGHAAGALLGSTVLVRTGNFAGQFFMATLDASGGVLVLSCPSGSNALQAVVLSVVGLPEPVVNTPVSRALASNITAMGTETQGPGMLYVGGAWVFSYLEANAGRLCAVSVSGTTPSLGAALNVAGSGVAPVLATVPAANQFVAFSYNSCVAANLYSIAGTTIASLNGANGPSLTSSGLVQVRRLNDSQFIAVGISGTTTPIVVFSYSNGSLSSQFLANPLSVTGYTTQVYLHAVGTAAAVLSVANGSAGHALVTITVSSGAPAASGELLIDSSGGSRQIIGYDATSLWLSWINSGADVFAKYSGSLTPLATIRRASATDSASGQLPSINGDWLKPVNAGSALSSAGRFLSWRGVTRLAACGGVPLPVSLSYNDTGGDAVFSAADGEQWSISRIGVPSGGNRSFVVKRFRMADK